MDLTRSPGTRYYPIWLSSLTMDCIRRSRSRSPPHDAAASFPSPPLTSEASPNVRQRPLTLSPSCSSISSIEGISAPAVPPTVPPLPSTSPVAATSRKRRSSKANAQRHTKRPRTQAARPQPAPAPNSVVAPHFLTQALNSNMDFASLSGNFEVPPVASLGSFETTEPIEVEFFNDWHRIADITSGLSHP